MIGIKSTLLLMSRHLVVAAFMATPMASTAAHTSLAVLDFELHDLTSSLQLEELQIRADSLRPMLALALEKAHGLHIGPSPDDAGIDRIEPVFDRPADEARLGRELNVDWLVSCRLQKNQKPAVYLRAQLINVSRMHIAADLVVEVRGDEEADHRQGINSLASQIADTLRSMQVIR